MTPFRPRSHSATERGSRSAQDGSASSISSVALRICRDESAARL